MSILRVKDDQGNYVEIPAIKGEPGASGVIDATTESALTGLLKGAGGHIALAVAGTDYVAPADMAAKQNKITASGLLKGDGAGGITAAVAGADYVAPVSLEAKQNKITASGLLKGNGAGGVTAAVIGTDYAPAIDYIVDQGTSGIWYYRKWNSGVAECWGMQTNVSGTFADWGNIYSYDIPSVSFPSGLFTALIYESAQARCPEQNAVSSINAHGGSISTASQITCIRGTAATGTYTFTAYRYAIGRWK